VIKLQPGEVIFISGAAGAVGSIACQIAKLMGATVIASAGGVQKCAYLKQLGVEKVIDYKKTQNLCETPTPDRGLTARPLQADRPSGRGTTLKPYPIVLPNV
jgi:NADPH:quinone reductase-like Zn-dependent oxidoreductase